MGWVCKACGPIDVALPGVLKTKGKRRDGSPIEVPPKWHCSQVECDRIVGWEAETDQKTDEYGWEGAKYSKKEKTTGRKALPSPLNAGEKKKMDAAESARATNEGRRVLREMRERNELRAQGRAKPKAKVESVENPKEAKVAEWRSPKACDCCGVPFVPPKKASRFCGRRCYGRAAARRKAGKPEADAVRSVRVAALDPLRDRPKEPSPFDLGQAEAARPFVAGMSVQSTPGTNGRATLELGGGAWPTAEEAAGKELHLEVNPIARVQPADPPTAGDAAADIARVLRRWAVPKLARARAVWRQAAELLEEEEVR